MAERAITDLFLFQNRKCLQYGAADVLRLSLFWGSSRNVPVLGSIGTR